MTTDLWMLVATALLSLAIPIIYAVGRFQTPGGFTWSLLNRDQPLAIPAWASRAHRAHSNLVENIGPFAILVIAAHLADKANGVTALGATIFFAARFAHVVVYTAGIPYMRTGAWVVGWIGGFMIFAQLLK